MNRTKTCAGIKAVVGFGNDPGAIRVADEGFDLRGSLGNQNVLFETLERAVKAEFVAAIVGFGCRGKHFNNDARIDHQPIFRIGGVKHEGAADDRCIGILNFGLRADCDFKIARIDPAGLIPQFCVQGGDGIGGNERVFR